jgi:hypothetical protein
MQWADELRRTLVGDDVLAVSSACWQALQLHPEP